MRKAVTIALGALAAAALAGLALAQAPADVTGAAGPIMSQLAAFRAEDYDTAYTFASEEIRRIFDRPAFERMVRDAYPEIARSTSAVVSRTEPAPDGHVYVAVRIHGANGNRIEALYDMVREAAGWRINGVVTRPDPGLVLSPLHPGERAG